MPDPSADPTALDDVPSIRMFQLDDSGPGDLGASVNLFRGAVSMPLQLISLRGRGGLDVNVTIAYSSDVEPFATTWNAAAPTSIVGLGWSLPMDMVVRSPVDPAAPGECTYYLVSAGVANELVRTGQDAAGRWVYILRNFEFWEITQDTAAQVWRVIKEDGTAQVYGGLASDATVHGIEWGVAWANWAGSGSGSLGAQQRFPLAWRLTSAISTAGDTIQYSYDCVEEEVGPGGLTYTKACYPHRIVDAVGRVVEFRYAEKLHGAAESGGATVYEYRDPHKALELDYPNDTPNAYQDRYETRYLDTVSVFAESGALLSLLRFGYDLRSFTDSAQASAYRWKRCLTSIRRYNSRGESLPGLKMEYYDQQDVLPGALATLTHPYGGSIRYHYSEQRLATNRQLTITGPEGATPRVWHGADYTVVAWYGRGQGAMPLFVSAYSWIGWWVEQQLINQSVQLDLATLNVIAADDYLAVQYRASGGDSLTLFRREVTQAGTWVPTWSGTFPLSTAGSPPATVSAAGDDFVVLANTAYANGPVQALGWDYRSRSWGPIPVPDLASDQKQVITVAGRSSFYAVCACDTTTGRATFTIIARDPSGAWSTTATWTDTFPLTTTSPELTLSLGPTYLVATAITALDEQALTTQTRTYLWNETLHLLDPDQPFVQTHTTPVVNGVPQSPVHFAVTAGSLIGNGPDLARYVGGITGPGFNPAPYWPTASFSVPDQNADCQYAYGDDVAVVSVGGESTLLTFDPNQPAASGWSAPVSLSPGGRHPTISGDYLTAGSTLYIRRPGKGWVPVLVDLPGVVDPASIQNRAPGYLVYQDTGGAAAQSYVVLLGNDGATVTGALPGGPQKVKADGAAASGTQLAGPSVFVTYPATGSFDTAESLTLYRVVAGDVTGSLTDHPVDSIIVDNGYGELITQGFLYDASTTTYDAITSVAQYTKVTSIPSVTEPLTDPSRPFGHTDHYFSNATLQQTDPFYPPGTQYNYDGLLNGVKLCEQDFDDTGRLTSSTVNYWQPYQSDPHDQQAMLPRAYFRRAKTVTSQDGMEPNASEYSYDSVSGLVTTTTTKLHDSYGAERKMITTTTYGYQVPVYAQALLAAHQLSTVVQRTTTVDDTPTTSKVTTLRDWGTGAGYWAAENSYQWLGTGTGPVFDFTGNASPHWLLLQRIVSRTAAGYQPTEIIDTRGTPTSYLYDKTGSYPIAQFFNASLAGDELAWADFEPYSTSTGWTVGGGASKEHTDAHTGVASLRLAPAIQPGLTAVLTPARQTFDYLLLAWVKTGPGFTTDPGDATWTVTLTHLGAPAEAAPTITVPVTDTQDIWVPVTIPIPVANATQPVTIDIRLLNSKTNAWIAVDDIRFSPLAGSAGVRVYDAATRMVTATIGNNADVTRIGLDTFLRQNLTVGAADNVMSLSSIYYSRDGNADVFSTIDPNAELSVVPRTGGSYDTFRSGDEWRARWRPDSPAWQVTAGQLAYTGTGAATLTATGHDDTASYVVRVRLRASAMLSAPLALRIGSRVEISWNPSDCYWRLTDTNTEQQSAPGTLFAAPRATYQQPLDNGTVPGNLREKFARYGCALSDPQVTVPVPGQRWVITDGATRASYYLNSNVDQITVSRPPYEWLVIVGANRVLVYADGRRRFSYLPKQPLSGAPSLAVADPVVVDDLVVATAPYADVTFQDGINGDRQAQQLLGTKNLGQQMVSDPLGRPAVRTKTITVTPTELSPLLTYQPDLVTGLDWRTGIMTGQATDAYPGDQGYPYHRVRFEPTPHGRVTEEGLPGKLLAIDLTNPKRHTTRYVYTTNHDTADGLPANQYHQRITTDANGQITSTLADRLGRLIRSRADLSDNTRVQQSFVEHDLYGNAVALRLPNYYDPPPGTNPTDWVIKTSYDFSGRLATRTAPTLGNTHCIYSPAGDLRFAQESAGAEQGVYLYSVYDALGRTVEAGQLNGTWDPVKLQAIANNDPTWPPSPPTWRKRISYDGNGTSPYTIGRPTEVHVNLGHTGAAETVERLTYDAWGIIVQVDTIASGYDASTHKVVTTHDNQGATTSVSVPSEPAFAPVVYQRDELGRVVAIGTTADPAKYAIYTYGPDSTVATETLAPGSATPIRRTFSYAPPLWPTQISHTFGKSSLTIGIDYTQGGLNGTGYYTGQVARLGIQRSWSGAPPDINTRLLYDPHTGAMLAAQTSDHPTWAIDSAQYDANGNIRTVNIGGRPWTYHYDTNDRLLSVDRSEIGSVALGYDGSGHVNTVSYPGRNVTFTIDQTLHRTRSALAQANSSSTTVEFDYTSQDLRLVKRVTKKDSTTSTLYLHGPGKYPLIEKTRDTHGNETSVLNIQGATGLIAIEPAHAEPLFLLTDHQNSTRAVVTTSGEIVAWYDYLPYGGLAQSTDHSPTLIRYLYTGQEYDTELDIYNYRSRFYDPTIGRFYAPDEQGQFAGPYTYAGNDPVSNIDPTGAIAFLTVLGFVVQAAISALLEVVSEGAATPLIVAELDAEATLLTSEEIATGATQLFASSTRAAEETAEGGARAVATNGIKAAGRESLRSRIVNDINELPPGLKEYGTHFTSSAHDESFATKGVTDDLPEHTFNKLRYHKGFYTTKDPKAGEFYIKSAIEKHGGHARKYVVYGPSNLSGHKVSPELDYTLSENDPMLSKYDYLEGDVRFGPTSPKQIKFNKIAYPNLWLVRKFSTLARRETFFRPPPKFFARNAVRLVRFFR